MISKSNLDLFPPLAMTKSTKSLDKGPFICSVCHKKYKYRRDLSRHIKSECINCPKNFPCNICDKAYFRLGHLQDHLRKRHRVDI